MMDPSSLTIDDLSFAYPSGPPVLDGVSMTVDPGERVALLGPNGSGKTTLALHLNGLLLARSGTIVVDGLAVEPANLAAIRRQVGMVFQDPDDQLFMHTVADDVAFGPANHGLDGSARDRAVTDALEAVGASELADRTPHHLSGGEKRRAALAGVLATDPGLLVLDEPTAGLDPVGHHELADLLSGLDRTQIIVTHDLPFALATCPRAVVLDRGRVVADLATPALLGDPDLLAAHRLALPFGYHPPRV